MDGGLLLKELKTHNLENVRNGTDRRRNPVDDGMRTGSDESTRTAVSAETACPAPAFALSTAYQRA